MPSVVAVHLGAGVHSARYLSSYEQLCSQAVEKGLSELSRGESILNAVAEATSVLEESPLTNAGIGSNLTFDGTVECDASIMDGETFASGSVGALTCVRNPIKVALAVAKQSFARLTFGRVPPWVYVTRQHRWEIPVSHGYLCRKPPARTRPRDKSFARWLVYGTEWKHYGSVKSVASSSKKN